MLLLSIRSFALVALLSSLVSAAESPLSFNLQKTSLALIPDGFAVGQVVFSPDGKRVVFSAGKDGKWYVFDGGKRGKAYDYVKMLALSTVEGRIAYSARKEATEHLVVDGREGAPHSWVCNPTFSPDGRTVAHETRDGNEFFITAGGFESPRYGMSLIRPVFSPDSRYLTYVLQDSLDGKSVNLVSETQTGRVVRARAYDHIGAPVFSPDGKWFAYVAEAGGKQFVVVNSFMDPSEVVKEGKKYDTVKDIIFSPDGLWIAYAAQKQGKNFLVISRKDLSGHREKMYDKILYFVFSPDGKYLLSGVRSGNELLWEVHPVE